MIYSCTNEECLWFGEGDTLPDACPRCGQALKERWEEELTGDEWCRLGLYWTEEEPLMTRKRWPAFAALPVWAAAGVPATWDFAWSRASGSNLIFDRRFGFTSRRWRWAAWPLCVIWESVWSRVSARPRTRRAPLLCIWRRRNTAPPGASGCWPTVWRTGSALTRTTPKRWSGCAQPPFRGRLPLRRPWPSTMSSA